MKALQLQLPSTTVAAAVYMKKPKKQRDGGLQTDSETRGLIQ